MQLVTYVGNEALSPRVGVLRDGDVVPVGGPTSMIELLRRGDDGLAQARNALGRACGGIAPDRVRMLAPLPRPNSMRDFMLVEEHVKNSFGSVPAQWYDIPVHWKGNPDSVIGPDDEVPWPHYTDQLDFELEVAAVIGRVTSRVGPDEARACIAGYTIFNDWSARDIQFREMSVGIGPAFGKDFATSLGPCLVTPDEFDVSTAAVAARINGETWSQGDLGSMRFSFPDVVSLLSQDQTLHPGDVLGGGTVGRGCGLELDRWIRPGDVVELDVEGIGVLRNTVGAKRTATGTAIDLTGGARR